MTPKNYPNLGIQLTVPAANDRAEISWQNAVNLCSTGKATCGDGTPPVVVLALVTTANGSVLGPANSVTPTIVARLAYVLSWAAVGCAPVGPAGGPPATPTQCLFITLIDAKSGTYLAAAQTNARYG